MRIAVIFPSWSESLFNKKSNRPFGGVNVQMYITAKELSNHKDIQTFSFIPDYKTINFDEKDKFNLIKMYKEDDSFYRKILKFNKQIKKIKPDVVIQNGLTLFSCLLAKYCKLKGIKFIYMFAHDLEAEGKYQSNSKKCILFNMLLGNSYKVITQNKYQQNKLLKGYNKESHIMYCSFPVKRAPNVKKDIILWVARCNKWKKPELFIALAKKNKDYNFLMICPGLDNLNYSRNVRKLSKDIPNLKFVPFAPFNEVDAYFQKAKIFVNTSNCEGFPSTFVQAAMNNTPIVSLNVNPDNFLIKYKCGLCANGDFDLMRKKVKQLLEEKKLWNQMSRNAYRYAQKNHDIKKNVNKLLGLIKK